MFRIINSNSMRCALLRSVVCLKGSQSGRQQLNQTFKRMIYEKKVTKPAPFFEKKVLMAKLNEGGPMYMALLVFYIAFYHYFQFYGVDYNEVLNYREFRTE